MGGDILLKSYSPFPESGKGARWLGLSQYNSPNTPLQAIKKGRTTYGAHPFSKLTETNSN